MITVEMLPANFGDSLWITYGPPGETRRILIDCGFKSTYRDLLRRLEALDARQLELVVLTHVDEDHIKGAVPLLSDTRLRQGAVGDVWFNGWRHLAPERGPLEGEFVSARLLQRKFAWNRMPPWRGEAVVVPADGPLPTVELEGGLRLTLLSPTRAGLDSMREEWREKVEAVGIDPGDAEAVLRALAEKPELAPDKVRGYARGSFAEDEAPANGSSIAMLAEYRARTVLLGGDAHPSVLEGSVRRILAERGLERLRLDAFKLAHHGSAHNTSPGLLEVLDCHDYLVSTNGARFGHPSAECMELLLGQGRREAVIFRFNYRSAVNSVWDDTALQERRGYRALYPDTGGRKLSLET